MERLKDKHGNEIESWEYNGVEARVKKVLQKVKMYWRDPYNGLGVEEALIKIMKIYQKKGEK